MNTKLKPIPQDEPKCLDAMSMEEITGRPFTKQRLKKPKFKDISKENRVWNMGLKWVYSFTR